MAWVDATTMLARQRDGRLVQFHVGSSTPEIVSIPGQEVDRGTRLLLVQRLG